MKPSLYSKHADGSTLTLSQTISGLVSYGVPTSRPLSSHTKLQYVWRWSRLHEAWKLQTISIVIQMEQPIWGLQGNLERWTGTRMAVIRNTNYKIWCDYCKSRYQAGTLKHETIARWTVIGSKGNRRFYCNDCVAEITHWACNCDQPRTCKKRFDLDQQLNYKTPTLEMEMSNGI